VSAVYDIPPKRRRIVTREEVEAAEDEAALAELLVDLIENDDTVRAAILRVAAGASKPRQPRPTVTTPVRRGRGR
jgi:hypothetical protein